MEEEKGEGEIRAEPKIPPSRGPLHIYCEGGRDGGLGSHQLWVGASERDGHQDLHFFTDGLGRKGKLCLEAHLYQLYIVKVKVKGCLLGGAPHIFQIRCLSGKVELLKI